MMLSNPRLSACMFLACMTSLGCSAGPVIPQGNLLTGESGGCGDFIVYRFNDDRTVAIAVRVDESLIDLSSGRTEIEFDSSTQGIEVEVLQFQVPVSEYFCDDVGGDPRPIAEWEGVSGTISIERTLGTPPAELANATHKVSIKLTGVQIKNSKTGQSTLLSEVHIEDAWVGWSAG